MARSHYIYLLWNQSDGKLAGAFTVKYESQQWAAREPGGLNAFRRTRMVDGGRFGIAPADRDEKPCPWEPGE